MAGNSLKHPRRKMALTLAVVGVPTVLSSWERASAAPAVSGTFRLEVNKLSGDVSIWNASTSVGALTLYEIADSSLKDLLIGNPVDGNGTSASINSGSAPFTDELFLSVRSTDSNAVASIPGRATTNYKAWSLVLDGYNSDATALALSEGGTANKTDTITVPSGYSIDLGDIFNVGQTTLGLSFEWGTSTAAGGEGGTVYTSAPIDYVISSNPNYYWKNTSASGNWSGVSNWSTASASGADSSGPPATGATVYIANADSQGHVVTFDQSAFIAALQIGSTGGGTDTLSQTAANDLAVSGSEMVGLSGPGIHVQSAGTNTYTGSLIVGDVGAGTYSLSGAGVINGSSSLIVGDGGSGTFNQSGGTITVNGESIGVGGGTGTFLQSGGIHTISSGELDLGGANAPLVAGNGSYFLSGTASLSVAGNTYIGGTSLGAAGIGTLAISGGAMSVGGVVQAYSAGTINISAGTLSAGTINVASGGALVQSGGTLKAGSLMMASGGSYALSGGTINAPVALNGKLVATASSTPIAINGSLSFASTSASSFQRQGATPNFPSISAAGNVVLGGNLSLYEDAANEAETNASQSFVLLSTMGTLSGSFSNISSGQRLETADDTASFLVTIDSGVDGFVLLSDFMLGGTGATLTYNWNGGTGNWSNATSWSSSTVPNVGTADVTIDNGGSVSVVTLDQNATIDSVALDVASTLNINSGQTLSLAGNLPSSFNGVLNNSGTLAVTGGTTTLAGGGTDSGAFTVASGAGLIFGGGTHSINGSLVSGAGTVAVTGGTVNSSGTLLIGSTGIAGVSVTGGTFNAGTVSITNGSLTLSGGTLGVAALVNSGGTLNWTAGTLAFTGSGSLVFDSSSASAYAGSITLGPGQALSALTRSIYIGNSSAGTLSENGGGCLTSTLYLGSAAGSTGIYNLGGTGSLSASFNEFVGGSGAGTFLQNGGTNSTGYIFLGGSAGSTGTYNLSGSGAVKATYEYIGNSGQGTFLQSGGTNSTTYFTLGSNTGSVGTYSLSGTGNLSVSFVTSVGGSGSGTLLISGGSMSAPDGLQINSTGALVFSGGTINAPVTASGNLIATASSTPIAVNGSLTFGSASTNLFQRAGSTPNFPSISTTGNITLGGTLSLYEDAANEAETTGSQSFVLLSTTGTLSGSFSNISSGQRLETTDNTASFLVTVDSGVDGFVLLSNFILGNPGPANSYWENSAGNGNFSNGSAWSAVSPAGTDAGGVPDTLTKVSITNTDSLDHVVTLDQGASISAFQIGSTGGGVDTLSQTTAVNLAVSGAATVTSGGAIVQSDGSLNAGSIFQSGGTVSLTSLNIGGTATTGTNAGSYKLTGGALAVADALTVYSGNNFTQSGGSVSAAQVTVNSGGTLSLSGGSITAPVSVAGTVIVSGPGQINAGGGIAVNGTSAKFVAAGTTAVASTLTLSSGTIDGTGTINAINIASSSSSAITNGNGAYGSLSIGAATFSGAATLNDRESGTTPGLNFTGSVTTTPANGVITVNAVDSSGWTAGTTYKLAAIGSTNDIGTSFKLGTLSGLSAGEAASALTDTATATSPGYLEVTINSSSGGSPVALSNTFHLEVNPSSGDVQLWNDSTSRSFTKRSAYRQPSRRQRHE